MRVNHHFSLAFKIHRLSSALTRVLYIYKKCATQYIPRHRECRTRRFLNYPSFIYLATRQSGRRCDALEFLIRHFSLSLALFRSRTRSITALNAIFFFTAAFPFVRRPPGEIPFVSQHTSFCLFFLRRYGEAKITRRRIWIRAGFFPHENFWGFGMALRLLLLLLSLTFRRRRALWTFFLGMLQRALALSLECWYLKSTSADYMTARVYEMRAPGELFERESRDFYLRKISLKNFLRIMNEVSDAESVNNYVEMYERRGLDSLFIS